MFRTPSLSSSSRAPSPQSLRAIPLAAAMTVAMLFGASVQAQTDTSLPVSPKAQDKMTMPSSSTMGNATGGVKVQGATTNDSASVTGGAKVEANTGMATAPMATPMTKPMTKGSAGAAVSTDSNLGASASLPSKGAKSAEARTMAKADKKAKRDAKRAMRKAPAAASNNTDASVTAKGSAAAAGNMSSPSPTK